ncbi:MAG TPA: dihydropteroate synthase [Longimicrobiales bacterium]|nr:dihydropteroate synthase [Longimicrobiales bacterium]
MPLAPAAVPLAWRTVRSSLRLDRPVIAGILNVTPDSFWDGGRHAGVEAAVRHAAAMIDAGADVLDIGGESTRPGASPVAAAEEAARVVPVVQALHREWPDVPISVDTVKSAVARHALDAGASIINDVSGLRLDAALAGEIARAGAGVVLMHSRGDIDRMASYDLAEYGQDPVAEVRSELAEAVDRARAGGIPDDAIVVDPGLGFAKRTAHSLALLARLDRIAGLGYPVLVGPSRKRFIGDAGGRPGGDPLPIEARLEGTIAACVMALLAGATLFRVHDVAPVRRALDFAHAARQAAGI